MRLYLDTSVLIPLYLSEAQSAPVARTILHGTAELFVSDFAAGEFGAAISTAVRTRRVTVAEANLTLANFDEWRNDAAGTVVTSTVDIRLGATFVRRFELNLRLPDAIHIAICRQHDLQLVTLDLGQAAAAELLGITVNIPE